MSTALWLRVASVWALLFTAGHTMGARKDWSPFGDSDVLKAMRNVRFDFQGVSRTYLDFYVGFGYTLSVFLLLQAVVLWQLATIAKTQAALVRPIVATFALASLTSALITWKFIFPVPAAFGAILTVMLALAYFATS